MDNIEWIRLAQSELEKAKAACKKSRVREADARELLRTALVRYAKKKGYEVAEESDSNSNAFVPIRRPRGPFKGSETLLYLDRPLDVKDLPTLVYDDDGAD